MAKQPVRQPVRDLTSRPQAETYTEFNAPAKSEPAKRGMPSKVCPQCNATIHAAKVECPECGHKFPPSQRRGKGAVKRGNIPDDIFELLDACNTYLGSFDDIDDAIAMVKQTESLIETCGGSEQAIEIMEKMRARREKSKGE